MISRVRRDTELHGQEFTNTVSHRKFADDIVSIEGDWLGDGVSCSVGLFPGSLADNVYDRV